MGMLERLEGIVKVLKACSTYLPFISPLYFPYLPCIPQVRDQPVQREARAANLLFAVQMLLISRSSPSSGFTKVRTQPHPQPQPLPPTPTRQPLPQHDPL